MKVLLMVLALLFIGGCAAPNPTPQSTATPSAAPSLTSTPTTTPTAASPAIPTATPAPIPPTPAPVPLTGEWVSVPGVPVGAWSAALLPTGKVLLFQSGSAMFLYDPETHQFSPRFSSQTNLFCAGLAFLADGRLLAVGGHEGKDPEAHFLGLRSAEVFDPWQQRWTRLPDMAGGERWYPTAILLPDGRALVASGTHAGKINETVEIFHPEGQEWQVGAQKKLPMYPWAAVMPQGEILFYGPQRPTSLFSPTLMAFSDVALLTEKGRSGGAGVLLNARTGQALALGGGSPPTQSAELFDPLKKRWQPTVPMAYPRHHPNAVLLPDGRVLVVGGHSEESGQEEEKAAKHGEPMPAEVFDPEQETWAEVARANYGHGYHSTALLLPDGSVLAAGPLKNLEVYFPWYFSRERPVIESAPNSIAYGQAFLVKTPDVPRIVKVVALRLSSVTHSLNTDQRYLELDFSPAPGGLFIQAPASPNIAISGYYLLFVVTPQKVPSQGLILLIH